MLFLDKKHNPDNNSKMISEITGDKQDIPFLIEYTDRLFNQSSMNHPDNADQRKQTRLFNDLLTKIIRYPFAEKVTANPQPFHIYVDEDGNVYPEWKKQLDEECSKLFKRFKKEVNIEDYGAVGDGKTDNTEAFKKAFGSGQVKVRVPAGVFVTKEIRVPSWTCLIGEGKGLSTIKLHENASIGTRLVTNANHWRGNHHIFIQGMSLDWNVERLGSIEKTSTWGNHSSCLTLANVSFAWVKDVEAINPGLHCFDVTSTHYNYSGDGYRARLGSKYIWLDHLNGYGFGDDGLTTHHSDYVFISHSHMCDPSGRAHQKGHSNSNGIEIDDGSRNILLVSNSTARCFGGVEIKAHEDSSAAANVQIVGHLSVNDNRSYNFRHIGHHKSTDPESQTAYNIKAINIVAIEPVFSELYQESTPRALVVSAYKNVIINNFIIMGDSEYDYKDNPVIAIQYRARNVVLNKITIKDFKKAGVDIKVFGGKHRADNVSITNTLINHSARQAIDIGPGIQKIHINNVRALGKGGTIGVKSGTQHVVISAFHADGYEVPVSITRKVSNGIPNNS